MNSVRKTEAWTAYDGSMHSNERDAILASINTILGTSSVTDAMLLGVNALKIEENLRALMPLFQRLLDPRNMAPKPGRAPYDREGSQLLAHTVDREGECVQCNEVKKVNVTGQCLECWAENGPLASIAMSGQGRVYDPREPEVLPNEGDMLTIVDAAADEGANEALHPGARIIEPDDLRVGQLVETRDGWGLLIEQITCDNEPQPVVVGMAAPDDETTPTRLTIALDDIIQIIKQPEDMMSKEDAERRLKEMSDEEIELKPDDPRRTQIHKSRILLMRRLERLRNGDDE